MTIHNELAKTGIPFLVKWTNDLSANWRTGFTPLTNIKEQERYLDAGQDSSKYYFVKGTDSSFIYNISKIDWINRSAVFGIIPEKPEPTDEDLITVILNICELTFKTYGLKRISTDAVIDNVAYIRQLESIGFKREVRKRQHRFLAGAYSHICEYSLLFEDFSDERIKNNSKSG